MTLTPSQNLQVETIAPSPTNPRKNFDKITLAELTESVRRHGVLQPILVRPWPPGRKPPAGWDRALRGAEPMYEIVAGERRYKAAQAAGLVEIPALVRDLTSEEVLEIQVVENLQRSDLHALEEAEGYRQLLAAKYDVARIAERVGRSVAYVRDRVKLLSLCKMGQDLFRMGKIAAGHAVILARLSPADQARAIGDPKKGGGDLFVDEKLLWQEDKGIKEGDGKKAITARELQAWVDKNVRFTIETPDLPDLFPETDVVIRAAKEEAEKIIPITHDHYVTPEAKDGSRTWGPASWERADGKGGSKTCEYSITGVIAVGYGRGDAFKVCVEKKKCKIHWGAEIRNAAARARNPAEGGDRAHELQQQDRKAKAEESRNDAERARWVKAWPKLIVALADAIKKASATATGPLGEILLGGRPLSTPGPLPPGKTAEDLVRHLAFKEIQKLRGGWYDWERKQFLTVIAGLSLDAEKIVDQVAPREPSCRHCGCTEAKACVGGCSWAKKPDPKTGLGLCSKCPQPAKKKKKAA